jgi:glycosyltransferase involved in cell wall biosynthesis
VSQSLCFLVYELGRSGGMKVISGYASALGERDEFRPELVVTGPHVSNLPHQHEGVPVVSLAEARERRYDVAIATWWATADHLYELRAARRFAFLQSVENRFFEERDYPLRFGAEAVLGLPVDFITVSAWIRDLIGELCPGARCSVVHNGIDKSVFAPRGRAPREGPLRVLVEGNPELWFKGVPEAVEAVRAMSEPGRVTVVAPERGSLDGLGADRVEGALDQRAMADLYAEHDVLLKLSRVESLGLPPIEAMHVGVPSVVTPFTGHEEYLEHGRNGLVVGYDDLPGTVRALDLLARDGALLARLSEGAAATARSWPSAERAADDFARAVLDALEQPAPPVEPALAYRLRAERRSIEMTRQYARQTEVALFHTSGALRWHENALEQAKDHIDDLNSHIRAAQDAVAQQDEAIAELHEARAYRFAVAARELYQRAREVPVVQKAIDAPPVQRAVDRMTESRRRK